MAHRTDSSGAWPMWDNVRGVSNLNKWVSYAHEAAAETVGDGSSSVCDFVSNGFKLRGTSSNIANSSGSYIWIAFAEVPFKGAMAR